MHQSLPPVSVVTNVHARARVLTACPQVTGPKMLMLAGTDRLDKPLTIGQMQVGARGQWDLPSALSS